MDGCVGNLAGYIYFILCEEDNLLKIGFSKSVERRLAAIRRTRKGKTLTLLGSVYSSLLIEFGIHNLFSKLHRGGEWYYNHHVLRKFMDDFLGDGYEAIADAFRTLSYVTTRFCVAGDTTIHVPRQDDARMALCGRVLADPTTTKKQPRVCGSCKRFGRESAVSQSKNPD